VDGDTLALLSRVEPLTIALVVAVCFLAAALSGLSGFGAGLIITAFITPIIGPKAVLPAVSVMMLITNASRVAFFRGALDWHVLGLVATTAIPASVLGARVYVELDAALIQILLGLVLVLSIPLRRWLAGRKVVAGPASLLLFGLAWGFLSSIMVGAGVLVIPMLLGAGLAGPALLATDAAITVVVNVPKIIAFKRLDALDLPLLAASLAMGLCTVPGTWLAAWIVRRTDIRIHTLAMEGLVMAGGAAILVGALAPTR
jgi:uncharacterized membrane protein YfcA